MTKNMRPNLISTSGELIVNGLHKIPPEYASRSRWRQRGYRVDKQQLKNPLGRVEHWNGLYYLSFRLYARWQCRKINGPKAKQRRRNYRLSDNDYQR